MAEKYLDKAGLQTLWSKIMEQINSINSNIASFATQSDLNTVSSNVTSLTNAAAAKALASDVSTLLTNVSALSAALSNYITKSDIESTNFTVTNSGGTLTYNASNYSSNTKIPQVKVVANALSTFKAAVDAKINSSAIDTSTTIANNSTKIPSSSAVKSNLDTLTSTANGKLTKSQADATYAKKTEVAQVMEYKGSEAITATIARLTASGVTDAIIGDVYNINAAFTITNSNKTSFVEYKSDSSITSDSSTHIKYPAGTNVVIVKDGNAYHLDILTGAFAFETLTTSEINSILS